MEMRKREEEQSVVFFRLSFPSIDFKATRLIRSRLLINNPLNNPFSLFHAAMFVWCYCASEK